MAHLGTGGSTLLSGHVNRSGLSERLTISLLVQLY